MHCTRLHHTVLCQIAYSHDPCNWTDQPSSSGSTRQNLRKDEKILKNCGTLSGSLYNVSTIHFFPQVFGPTLMACGFGAVRLSPTRHTCMAHDTHVAQSTPEYPRVVAPAPRFPLVVALLQPLQSWFREFVSQRSRALRNTSSRYTKTYSRTHENYTRDFQRAPSALQSCLRGSDQVCCITWVVRVHVQQK